MLAIPSQHSCYETGDRVLSDRMAHSNAYQIIVPKSGEPDTIVE